VRYNAAANVIMLDGQGHTATHAMVIARLLLPRQSDTNVPVQYEDMGIYNFIVPLRNLDTYELLPGIRTGDIGPKIGFNNMDNVRRRNFSENAM
jgi:acyl-CoA oxidase